MTTTLTNTKTQEHTNDVRRDTERRRRRVQVRRVAVIRPERPISSCGPSADHLERCVGPKATGRPTSAPFHFTGTHNPKAYEDWMVDLHFPNANTRAAAQADVGLLSRVVRWGSDRRRSFMRHPM